MTLYRLVPEELLSWPQALSTAAVLGWHLTPGGGCTQPFGSPAWAARSPLYGILLCQSLCSPGTVGLCPWAHFTRTPPGEGDPTSHSGGLEEFGGGRIWPGKWPWEIRTQPF